MEKEDHIFRELLRRCPDDFSTCTTIFERLVKMQHYSLPTRLLDITSNPLVALYFACKKTEAENGKDEDGALIIYEVNENKIHYFDDNKVCLLSNIALLPFDAPLKRNQWGFNQIVKQAKSENHDFFMKDSMLNDVLCVMPKLDNPRIIRQSGAFFLFGCDEKKSKPATLSIPKYKIQIKKRRKKKILSELDSLGINESLYSRKLRM